MTPNDGVPTIGLLMDFVLPGVIEGAGAYAREHGLRIDARWSVRADWMPSAPGWDGAIVKLIDMEDAAQRTRALELPLVFLGESLGWEGEPRIDCDYEACGVLAMQEFKRLDLKRVAVPNWTARRVENNSLLGITSAGRNLGIEVQLIHKQGWRPTMAWLDEIAEIADELALMKHPCGLFLPHAGVAFSLLDALRIRRISVPDDLPIIVIDKESQRTAELSLIPLTSVDLDHWKQGYEAASQVHRIILGVNGESPIRKIPPAGLTRRQSTGVETNRDPIVAQALHVMTERLPDLEGVDALAAAVGVSRRTLETRFRKGTGQTVHTMLTSRRIESAKRLLRSSTASITRIAEIAGFSSLHYFSTAFKRETGETPGHYRSQNS